MLEHSATIARTETVATCCKEVHHHLQEDTDRPVSMDSVHLYSALVTRFLTDQTIMGQDSSFEWLARAVETLVGSFVRIYEHEKKKGRTEKGIAVVEYLLEMVEVSEWKGNIVVLRLK